MKKLIYVTISIYFIFTTGIVYAQTDTLTIDGLKRVYIVHVPSSYNGAVSVPLVIAIHNAYGTASSFITLTGFNAKANTEGFIVVYPSGTGNPTSWNAGSCCYSAASNNLNDIGFISAIIDTLTKKYNIDTAKIYAAGFSNGSMMAYRAAAELSTKIAAVGTVSGQMVVSNFHPARPVSIIEIHALDDSSVPYYGGSGFSSVDTVVAIWGRYNGCTTTPDTIYNANGILGKKWKASKADADIVLYRWNTGGHSWPTSPLSATTLIWDFFKSHPMKSVTNVSQGSQVPKPGNFHLNQNYPNPFNPSTDVSFDLPSRMFVWLKIYDMLGREVETLVSEELSSGSHSRRWNAANRASGVYFYRLQTSSFTETKKIVLLR